MSIEQEIFYKKLFQAESLVAFGFLPDGDDFIYHHPLLEGEFEARLRVSDGQLTGQVWDCDMDEEYTAFRVARAPGAFVGQVREVYQALLEEIAERCCVSRYLVSEQGQRLVLAVQNAFGDKGGQPFAKFPNIYAFRNPINDRWYALALQLKRGKLDLGEEVWTEAEKEELVEVINVKVLPEHVSQLVAKRGIYPSYHMNKKHWITVVLDESLTDPVVFDLVATSRQLTLPKGYQSATGPDYWVIPANPKCFDIDTEFAQIDEVYWTQKSSIKAGDLVCMYVTAPVQAVRYVCQVLEANIAPDLVPEEESDKPLMKVRRVHTFADTVFPFDRMKSLGVRAVRGPRRLTKEMMEAVQEEMKTSSAFASKEKD